MQLINGEFISTECDSIIKKSKVDKKERRDNMVQTKKNDKKNNPDDLDEQIRKRAYEIFKDKSENESDDLSDWLQAEKEIKNLKSSKKK